MDNITIIKELKQGIDSINVLLNKVEEILSIIDDDDIIESLLLALEALYIKVDVTRHCIQEIKTGSATDTYGIRVIEDNRKTIVGFEEKIIDIAPNKH
tara:strand:+ start:115 stop:408 length:294 start_codon:yes stop_codon:yes gene_type:complete